MRGKYRIRFRNKIYISYLTSYLVIGVMPLILTLVGYKYCEKTLMDEIRLAQGAALSQLQSAFDRNVEGVVRAAQLLAGSSRVVALAEAASFHGEDHLEIEKLRSEILLQLDKLELCSDITVYFRQTDTFLNRSGVFPRELEHLYHRKSKLSNPDLDRILGMEGARGYVAGKNTEGENFLYFIENVYSYNLKEKRATIFIEIPWANVRQLSLPVETGVLYWQNSEGETLMVTSDGEEAGIPAFDMFVNEGELLYTGAGKDSMISSYRNSECYDWKYCVSMRERDYFADLNRIKLMIWIQMFLLLSASVLLALYYSNRRYAPVERILEAVRRNQKAGKTIEVFGDVERYLEHLYQENEKLSNSWKKAQESMAGEMITGYLKGWSGDSAMVREILAQKALFLEEGCQVFLITLRDIKACRLFVADKKKEEGADREEMELLEFVFRNIFGELVLQDNRGMLLRMDANYLYLVQAGEQSREKICRALQECCDAYGNYLNLDIFIGGSGVFHEIEELPRAYHEALQVLAYQSFWGNDAEVISFYAAENGEGDVRMETEWMAGDQGRMYNLMQAGQYEEAGELLEEMMNRIFIRDMHYTKMNQYRMSGLMNTICGMLTEILGKNDEEFLRELRPMERLMKETSIDAARGTMLTVFREITVHLEQCREEKPRWVTDAIREIEENYTNINLGIAMLSEKNGLNLAYMGRTFKLYTGLSIPDYIHGVRIRECKRLLTEGVSVKEAAERVGYADVKTLIRVFKKQEGITPGQFKELARGG